MDTIDLFENSVNDGEEFEEELTAAEVLQKMEDSWLNEKHSPELLESKMEIVECMMEQVNTMEENLSRLKKGRYADCGFQFTGSSGMFPYQNFTICIYQDGATKNQIHGQFIFKT
jgi:hypothetical protein